MKELINSTVKEFKKRIIEDLASETTMILELAGANVFNVEDKTIRSILKVQTCSEVLKYKCSLILDVLR